MQRTEGKDQLDIIKSIQTEGGYAKKWASMYGVGNPDLVCALPGIGNFLMECKMFDGELSAKQGYELTEFSKAGGLSIIAIILRKYQVYFVEVSTLLRSPEPAVWDSKSQRYTGILRQIAWCKNAKQGGFRAHGQKS